MAEKILNRKELEFYKWDGDLSELLQNVRDKLNKVAEVCRLSCTFSCSLLYGNGNLFVRVAFLSQSWTREEKNHCLEETEKSFKYSGEILRLILS